MTCPYRYWDSFAVENWMCKLALQRCPEGYLEGFVSEECSTYKEQIKKRGVKNEQ